MLKILDSMNMDSEVIAYEQSQFQFSNPLIFFFYFLKGRFLKDWGGWGNIRHQIRGKKTKKGINYNREILGQIAILEEKAPFCIINSAIGFQKCHLTQVSLRCAVSQSPLTLYSSKPSFSLSLRYIEAGENVDNVPFSVMSNSHHKRVCLLANNHTIKITAKSLISWPNHSIENRRVKLTLKPLNL